MPHLRKFVVLIVLLLLVSPSIQTRNELSNLLNNSFRKNQDQSRWLKQILEPLKSRFESTFSNDHITYEDARMFMHLMHEIRRLESKFASPIVYWYSRMG